MIRYSTLAAAALLLLGVAALRRADAYSASQAGYTIQDSDESTGPVFQWDDLSATGAALTFPSPDDSSAVLQLPFDFAFLPDPVTGDPTIYPAGTPVGVCINGFLQLGGVDATPVNATGPSPTGPNAAIGPFWDNLALGPEGQVRWQTLGTAPNRRLVVSWIDVASSFDELPGDLWTQPTNDPLRAGPHRFEFQAALYEGPAGGIRFQYDSMADNGGTSRAAGQSATVALEDASGTLQIAYLADGNPGGNGIGSGLAIGFWRTGETAPFPLAGSGGGGGGGGGTPPPPPSPPPPPPPPPAGTPNAPVDLVQADDPGGPPAGPGYVDDDFAMSFRARVSHTDPAAIVRFQVEGKPNGSAFDGAGLADGATVTGAGDSEATIVQTAPGPYRWRGRTLAGNGSASAWVEFEPSPNPDYTITPGFQGPQPPTDLVQSDDPDGPPEAAGFQEPDGRMSFRALVSHTSTAARVALQIEAKSAAVAFDGSGLSTGDFVTGQGIARVDSQEFGSGSYRWRARTYCDDGTSSGWVEFAPTQDPDFTVPSPPSPAAAAGSGGSGGGSGCSAQAGGTLGPVLAAMIMALGLLWTKLR